MAKKRRYKQQPQQKVTKQAVVAAPAAASTPQPVAPAEARRTVAPAAAAPRGRSNPTWEELSQQYLHVNAELKQLGIIAGSFLVALLILTAILG